MDILFSHFSALTVLRSYRCRAVDGVPPDKGAVPAVTPGKDELLREVRSSGLLRGLELPIELLAGSHKQRSKTIYVHRLQYPLPRRAILNLGGFKCVSPEHVVVQMASRLDDLQLAVLLGELMGTYAIDPILGEMRQVKEPMTTPDALQAYLEDLGSFPGTSRVRRCLRMMPPGSGSPRETRLALRLSLPPALGGYHLPVAALNMVVNVQGLRADLPLHTRRPDILLAVLGVGPGREGRHRYVAIEYDGATHYGEERHARDVERQTELMVAGLKEYVVGRQQYADLEYMDGLASLIRKDLGMSRIGLTRDVERRRRELRRQLYLRLEAIDERGLGSLLPQAELGSDKDGGGPRDEDVVPVSAYGLD